jgi:hypothetical protein
MHPLALEGDLTGTSGVLWPSVWAALGSPPRGQVVRFILGA